MVENQLRIGHYVALADQRTYQITAIEGMTLSAESLVTHETITFSVDELFGQGTDELPVFYAPTLERLDKIIQAYHQSTPLPFRDNDLPASFLEKARKIVEVVEFVNDRLNKLEREAVKRGSVISNQTDQLRAILRQSGFAIGLTTYYKYSKLYKQHDASPTRIAASMRRSSYNKTRLSNAQIHLVETMLVRYYLTPKPVRIGRVYEYMLNLLQRTEMYWIDPDKCRSNIPEQLISDLLNPDIRFSVIKQNAENTALLVQIEPPSSRWIYQYAKFFEDQNRSSTHLRYGTKQADEMWAVYDSYVTRAQRPLQYVFADHHLIDLFVLDDSQEPTRLWVTLLIDAYTRCVLGMSLLKESPCIESIQSALFHAIWQKKSHEKFGIKDEWACYGIPENLSLDNAWAHHSYSLEELARTIGQRNRFTTIALDFRPPYKARYGALIERFFGRLSSDIQQHIRGAIYSTDRERKRKARQEAVHSVADLDRMLHELVVMYQHRPHSALNGMTPHEKWIEAVKSFGLPLIPRRTEEMERLFWRLCPDTRLITSKGISAFGLHYWSDELSGAQRYDQRGKSVEYSFRFNPQDISRLAIFRDGTWIGDVTAKELRLPDGTTEPLSLADKKLAQEAAKRAARPATDWLKFTEYWTRLGNERHEEMRRARGRKTNGKIVPFEVPVPSNRRKSASANNVVPDEETELLATFLSKKRR